MRASNSVPDCGPRSLGVRGGLADRRAEAKKKFICVTTRGRIFWVFNSLGRGLGSLASLSLCLGMLSFGRSVLSMLGLPPRCLPAVDLPHAIPVLAVALVPAPCLVLATAPLTQTGSDAWPACSGRTAMVSRTLANAHGRYLLPRESSGRLREHSLRAQLKHELDGSWLIYRITRNETKNETDLKLRISKETPDSTSLMRLPPHDQKRCQVPARSQPDRSL
jgi:hypothetical protein